MREEIQDVDFLPIAGTVGDVVANRIVEPHLATYVKLENCGSKELFRNRSCRKFLLGFLEITAGALGWETLVNKYFIAVRDENVPAKAALEHASVQVPLNLKA